MKQKSTTYQVQACWGYKTGSWGNNSSDFSRASGIISNFYGLNNNYGNGQPTKNLFHQYDRNLYMNDSSAGCNEDASSDTNLGYLISCFESKNSRIIFEGCFKGVWRVLHGAWKYK